MFDEDRDWIGIRLGWRIDLAADSSMTTVFGCMIDWAADSDPNSGFDDDWIPRLELLVGRRTDGEFDVDWISMDAR